MWSGLDGFPAFYEREPVFGQCARFTQRQQPVSNADWLKELFGKTYQYAIIDFPTSLSHFSSQAPAVYGYSPDYLIDNHTAAPYYFFGHREDQILRAREGMKAGSSISIHVYAGLSNSNVSRPVHLRICKACLKKDNELYGEGHWYMDHQLAGISVCPRHGTYLSETNVPSKGLTSFITVENAINISSFSTSSISPNSQLIQLALTASYLLSHPDRRITLDELHRLYYIACAEKHLLFPSGRVDIKRATETVRDYCSSQVLDELNLSLAKPLTETWAFELLAAPNVVRPTIKHLLVITGLGFTIQNFLALVPKPNTHPNPFGIGPWPCINHAASHFMALMIKTCTIHKINGQVQGEFRCECGQVYSLTEPRNGKISDVNSRMFQGYTYRVLEYGEIWDALLQKMWTDSTLNLKQMGLRLGVTADAVKAQGPRLGLTFPPAGSPRMKTPKLERTRKNARLRIKYEALWLKMRESFSEASISELQLLMPKQSMYLRLYDKEWFKANCPAARPRSTQHIDWGKLDTPIVEQVEQAAIDLIACPHPEYRITAAVLSKQIGLEANFLSSRRSKLPKTNIILQQYVETPLQHALHRLRLIQERCRIDNVSLTASQLRKRAGISDTMLANFEVAELIDTIIDPSTTVKGATP